MSCAAVSLPSCPPAQFADETYDISTRARICLPSGLNLYVYNGEAKDFVYCDYQQVVVVLWLFGVELEFAFKFGGGSSAWAWVSKVQVHDVLDSQRQAVADSSESEKRNTFLMRSSLVDSGEAVVTPIRSVYFIALIRLSSC